MKVFTEFSRILLRLSLLASLALVCCIEAASSSSGSKTGSKHTAGGGSSITIGIATVVAVVIVYFLVSGGRERDVRVNNSNGVGRVATTGNGSNANPGLEFASGKVGIGKTNLHLSEQNIRNLSLLDLPDQGAVVSIAVSPKAEKLFVEEFVPIIRQLTEIATVIIVQQSSSTEPTFANATLGNTIAPHRYLYHNSDVGKIAIVRQLSPHIHIDFENAVCEQLCQHVRIVRLLQKGEEDRDATPTAVPATTASRKTVWRVVANIGDLLK